MTERPGREFEDDAPVGAPRQPSHDQPPAPGDGPVGDPAGPGAHPHPGAVPGAWPGGSHRVAAAGHGGAGNDTPLDPTRPPAGTAAPGPAGSPDWGGQPAASPPGPSDPAPASYGAAPGGGASYGQPGAPWQPQPASPPPTQPGAAGPWPGGERGFGHAQGTATNWNFVDAIRSSELVPTRRIPPERGWRKAVYTASFNLINLGQSADERYQSDLETKIRSLLRGRYKIAVLGKGGVGKSTVAACVGSIFAELRKDDRVVAVDADTAFGKLGSRIDPASSGSYWELAADRQLYTFGDIRSRLGANTSGLFVLPGEAATARRRLLDAAVYREAATLLDRHFTLSILDCGSTLDSPVTREALNDADALIVVTSPWYDGASAAGQTLEWLANNGFTGLLHRTVVVINDSDGHAAQRDRRLLAERFGGRGQKVIELPYDQHLRPGGVIDVKNDVTALTRRRLMELAAACAEHFAATADRPRVS